MFESGTPPKKDVKQIEKISGIGMPSTTDAEKINHHWRNGPPREFKERFFRNGEPVRSCDGCQTVILPSFERSL